LIAKIEIELVNSTIPSIKKTLQWS